MKVRLWGCGGEEMGNLLVVVVLFACSRKPPFKNAE
jgi:hypothetical protein